MLFKSTLCEVCTDTLQTAFSDVDTLASGVVPHHRTKESLIHSVLCRNCHLCRLIIFHLKLRWAPVHFYGKEEQIDEPTTLKEDDFEHSDFTFAEFSSDRSICRSYMLDLDENLSLHAQIQKYGDGANGTYGIVEFDCEGFDKDIPRFWIFDRRGDCLGRLPI